MNFFDIYPNFGCENEQYECKARLNRNDTISWMKTIDGFSNNRGGILFIGVEDKTFNLIGFDSVELDKEKMFLFNTINEHFTFHPLIKIDILPYEIRENKRFIMKVNVKESSLKPVILKYQGMPMIFMRRDGFTNPATAEEIRDMSIQSNFVSFDNQNTDIIFDINDFSKLTLFYSRRNDGKNITTKELKSIGFVNEKGFIKKGAYLFSDKYNGEDTKVVCSLYRGETRGDNNVIASNTFKGNLIDSYQFIWEFLEQRMNHGFIKTDTGRINVDAYNSRALFEAIINALAHRNYFLQGTQISVDLFSNRLVISSPGSLYNGGDLKATYNFDSFISRRRNELICNIFVYCNAMEAKGTGFEKIKEEYKKYNAKHQPYIFSKNNQFSIVLPDITNEKGIDILDESFTIIGEILNPTRFDKKILSFCYNDTKSIKEISEYLGVANSSFLRNNVINNLSSQNYILESKVKNTKKYISNKQKIIFN